MGWRSTKASMDSGTYEPNVDTGGSFAQGFASSFVPMLNNAVSSYASEQKEKRMIELKEDLLRKRESIKSARTSSGAASKLATEQAELLATARSVASTLNIDLTQANLEVVLSAVEASDGKGFRAIDVLTAQIDGGMKIFEQATQPPSTGTPAPAPEPAPEPVTLPEAATTPVEDEMSSLNLPTTTEAPVVKETASLVAPPVETEDTTPADASVQVAQLGVPGVMIDMATGNYPADSVEAGEELAIKVADTSGNVEGAESLSFESPELVGATKQQRTGVLRFTGAVTPINTITDEDTLNANLVALEGRTDQFAVNYRQQAQQIRFKLVDLPDIATMERAQLQQYINGGYQEYAGRVPDENLREHLRKATEFERSGQSMPPIPASLDDQTALFQSIQSGVYGPIENIPSSYLANLSTFIRKNEVEEQLGDALSIPNLMGGTVEDLDALSQILSASGVPDGTVTRLLSIRKEQEANAEFETYSTGVNTSLEAINAVATAEEADASPATIFALRQLQETLTARENEKAAKENGITVEPVMSTVVIEGVRVIRQVMRDPSGVYTMPDGSPAVGAQPMSDEFIKRWDSIKAENMTGLNTTTDALLAMSEGLRNAQNVIDIAAQNGDVLNFGGDVAQTVTGFVRGGGSAVGVLSSLFKDQSPDYRVTENQFNQALRDQGLLTEGQSYAESVVNGLVSGDVQELAKATSNFEGQMILLAFRMGALEGQSGNAMSNKDFDRLMSIISTSNGSVDTFRQKLHTYMGEKIKGYDDRAQLLNERLDSFEETFSVTMSDMAPTSRQFVEKRDDAELTTTYQFFANPLPVGSSQPASTGAETGTQSYETLINNRTAVDALVSNVGKLRGTDMLDTYLGVEAQRLNLTVDQLKALVAQEQAQ